MKTMKTCKTGCGKMKSGGKVAAVKKMAKGGYAPAQTGGDNTKMNIFGIPNAGTTGPNRTAGYQYKSGGTAKAKFGASVAVKASCKKGMVRSADGKCVMGRPKFKSGGFPDLNKDGKVTKADILKGRGVIKRMGGAKKK